MKILTKIWNALVFWAEVVAEHRESQKRHLRHMI